MSDQGRRKSSLQGMRPIRKGANFVPSEYFSSSGGRGFGRLDAGRMRLWRGASCVLSVGCTSGSQLGRGINRSGEEFGAGQRGCASVQ